MHIKIERTKIIINILAHSSAINFEFRMLQQTSTSDLENSLSKTSKELKQRDQTNDNGEVDITGNILNVNRVENENNIEEDIARIKNKNKETQINGTVNNLKSKSTTFDDVIKFDDGQKQGTNNQTRLVINTGNVFIYLQHICWILILCCSSDQLLPT
jgi:hypothetical protein